MSQTLDMLYFLFPLVLASMVPLALVALGALFSERSGVINIALEGIMVMGGFVGIMSIRYIEMVTSLPAQLVAFLGLLIGAVAGFLFSFFHAYASINMKSDQIISATALNLFAPALAVFVARTIFLSRRIVISGNYLIREVPFLSDIPIIGELFFARAYLSTYLGVVIFIVLSVVLYKTRLGLRIRSCGENPHAADSLGVNIYRIRYIGVLISGALAGMGGVIFVLSFATRFDGTVVGFGFLALAVLIFGQWHPRRILYAAFFFAAMRVIAGTYSGIPVLQDIPLPAEVYRMLPYVATLVVLAFVSKKSQAPRAAGEPYDVGKR
jgi:general nucleoside transport system permease protein